MNQHQTTQPSRTTPRFRSTRCAPVPGAAEGRRLHLPRQCRRRADSAERARRGDQPSGRPQRPARRPLRPRRRPGRRRGARERGAAGQRVSAGDLLRHERHLVHPAGQPRHRPDAGGARRDRRHRHGSRRQHRHLAGAGERQIRLVAHARGRQSACRRSGAAGRRARGWSPAPPPPIRSARSSTSPRSPKSRMRPGPRSSSTASITARTG